MTRKIAFFSKNSELIKFVEVSSLTLTKLNHQVTIIFGDETIAETAGEENIDLIIIDSSSIEAIPLVRAIRKFAPGKKILVLKNEDEENKAYFESGADSVMIIKEFKGAVTNILIF